MKKLTPADLWKLEDYARERNAFRAEVLAHKKDRRVHLGEHLTLLFEDRLTIQYQIQEMLRVERIFEAGAIAEELETYNPLIPAGTNFKATLLIEYADVEQRKRELHKLRVIEHAITLEVAGEAPVTAIADEDLQRSNDSKTSAVHFLRFELTAAMIAKLKNGETLRFTCTHPHYTASALVEGGTLAALVADLG